jgi:Flp pilus assembly protein CpaB
MTNGSLGVASLYRLRGLLGPHWWPRKLLLRRAAAIVLLISALLLAFWPRDAAATGKVLLAAHDLPPGHTLASGDLRVAELPVAAIAAGSLRDTAQAKNKVLVGAARSGEALTDVRVAGQALTAMAGPHMAAVPVRLADPAVAELLRPGTHVDVVGAPPEGEVVADVLATDVTVLTVREPSAARGPAETERGRLVLVALPQKSASTVAAASLTREVTITLR